MLSRNGLMQATGVKVPIGEKSNDNELEPVYLKQNGAKMASQLCETFSH